LWGLAADPLNPDAMNRLRMAKWIKPGPRPFVLLVEPGWISTVGDSDRLPADTVARIIRLIAQFWPGGLTLVLPARPEIPADICLFGPNGPTVAIRCDDHPIAKQLCSGFGRPLISTSANRTGHPAAATLNDVSEEIRANALVLDVLPRPTGIGSTVLDLTISPPVVRREGRVPTSELLSFFE
jgi:L-threonylcarbamoyladenylate synthase